VKDVGEGLLSRRLEDEARLRVRLLEEERQRFGDGATVAPPREPGEGVERLGDRRQPLRSRLGDPERMETSVSLAPLEEDVVLDRRQIEPQNTRRTAEALVGAFDEIVYNLLSSPLAEQERSLAVRDMVQFGLRAAGYLYTPGPS